jgi:hypothetical protein
VTRRHQECNIFIVSLCARWHMLVMVGHVQFIQEDGYDCNVICNSCGMVQFCCIGSLFVQSGVLKLVFSFQISLFFFVIS